MIAKTAPALSTIYQVEWQDELNRTWYIAHHNIRTLDEAYEIAARRAQAELQRYRVTKIEREVVEMFDPSI